MRGNQGATHYPGLLACQLASQSFKDIVSSMLACILAIAYGILDEDFTRKLGSQLIGLPVYHSSVKYLSTE